jgi:hypothetical protein
LDLTRNPGPRVDGYDVLAPPQIIDSQLKVIDLTRVPPVPCDWQRDQRLFGFQYVAVHPDLFGDPPLWPASGKRPGLYASFGDVKLWPTTGEKLIQNLDQMRGFHRVSSIEGVVVFKIVPRELPCRPT